MGLKTAEKPRFQRQVPGHLMWKTSASQYSSNIQMFPETKNGGRLRAIILIALLSPIFISIPMFVPPIHLTVYYVLISFSIHKPTTTSIWLFSDLFPATFFQSMSGWLVRKRLARSISTALTA